MKIKISEVQIIPIKANNGLVGFASLVINNDIYLGSIGIMTRPEGGYRLIYPTKKTGNRDMNVYFPINKSCAELLEKEVIEKFEDVMNNDRHNSFNT